MNASFFRYQQDNQSVVFSFLTHTVLFSQLIGKLEAVASVYLFDSYDECLHTRTLFQSKQSRVHGSYGTGTQYSVGIADVAGTVL